MGEDDLLHGGHLFQRQIARAAAAVDLTLEEMAAPCSKSSSPIRISIT